MECPSCHSETPEDSRFCDVCGAAVPGGCAACGATNRPGARFCVKCGKPLTADGLAASAKPAVTAPAAPAIHSAAHPERRQLTVIFVDLVGSTALSARLDPEDMREIIGAYHRCCAEQITKFGGFVAKYLGDGALAYFGYPQAHEDDAERAIQASLALIKAVPKVDAQHDAALQVRVGAATGLVVVGDLIGEGVALEHGVVGDTPNLAARLQTLAEPGHVVISNTTRRLTGDMFDYRDLGKVTLKGLADPVQAWQVLGSSTLESRFEAQHGAALTPLVGREEELELLLRRWRQAASGEGRVVLISGEPGIGKSRLTVALWERLQGEPPTRLRYFCSPHHTDSALYPVIAQLERAAGSERQDAPETRLEKLMSLLDLPSSQDTDNQLLAELLSIPTGDRYTPLNVSPQRKKEKTFEALLRQLKMLSSHRPVLVVYEDVQWMDPSSRELLDMTVDCVASLPVLVVITFRPEFQPPWSGHAHVSTLSLSRLGRREGAALVERVAGNHALPNPIMAEIVERTDGIPLFVEEVTKAVLEAGTQDGGREERIISAPPSSLAVPATLHASLVARLDRLGPLAREIAQVAAVIGREFHYELLVPVAQKSENDVRSALGRLTDAGLVFCRGTPPQATLLFKHALVRDAAYECLLRKQRQLSHARVASALEQQFPDIIDRQPELMAQHWTEAGATEKAIAYWSKAAQKSYRRIALLEAIAQSRKGLALVPRLSETPLRWLVELELQMVLGWSLFQAKGGGTSEVGDISGRIRALCDQLGDRSHLGPALYMQGAYFIARAQYAAARQVSEELLHVAAEQDDAEQELAANQNMGRSLFFLGALSLAAEHFERTLNVSVKSYHRSLWYRPLWYIPADASRTIALSYLGLDLVLLGHIDQAVARRDQALDLAKTINHRPFALASALNLASAIDRLRGAERAEVACLTELAEIARARSYPFFLAIAELGLARRMCTTGETAEGLARARQAVARVATIGASMGEPGRLILLADCCERAGHVDEALELLNTALEVVNATDERISEAELYRLKGEWLRAHRSAGDAEAEASYQRALAVAQEQQAKLWELRASASLARLWRDQGKRSKARDLLAPIYGWFTEGFDTPDLKEAKALLEELA